MPVAALLSQLATPRGVEELFATLGIRGPWHRLDPGGLDAAVPIRRLAAVTPPGALPWIVLHGRDGRRAAQGVARARIRLGAPAGIACLDRAGRTLVLTVALQGAPLVEVSLDHPDPVALGILERLPSLAGWGVLEGAAVLAEWLAIEPPGTRFFRAFRSAFERMRSALPAGPRPEECDVLALLQLTRVLFLYFIQGKGWLDGRADFLARQVDHCLSRRRNLHRDLLHPLWFGTLNRPIGARGRAATHFGRIPFLNGGLFDVHPLERRWPCRLPNNEWRSAFDTVFERFQFVTREGDATAIGPDTLGRVFEGLMEPGARRASGTFYTPALLVQQVVQSGVAAWIAQRTGAPLEEALMRLERRDPALRDELAAVTVLDPAAGSGAFLLGALEFLACLTRGAGESPAGARRRVVARNLFGVDVNPAALRLAELRLWLAVIACEEDHEEHPVPPLPNLDAVVRQGDSLWGRAESRVLPDAAAAGRVRDARAALAMATGQAKRWAVAQLRRAEESAARTALTRAIGHVEHRIREQLEAARALSLFGERPGLGADGSRRLEAARRERASLRHALRRLDRTGELEHFDYTVQFADVMLGGGFDLVAGNPPWVRGETLPSHVRRRLAARYRWYGSAGGRGYRNAADLSVAFVERSFELLREGGVLTLLVPAKIRHAGYAASLRAGLGVAATLHVVAEVARADARAFDATVYPMSLVAGKASPGPGHRVCTALDQPSRRVSQSALAGTGPWFVGGDEAEQCIRRILARHARLGDTLRPQLGVKTGANHVFLTREPDIERRLLRRAVRGRDVTPEGCHPQVWLRWPCTRDGTPLPELPPRARAWFERHARALRQRTDYRDGPPWRLFRTRAATSPHRVVWADIARTLLAVPLPGEELIPLNTCYVLATSNAALARTVACHLNSTWCRVMAHRAAPVAAGGFRRFNARVVEQLPWPETLVEMMPPELDPVAPAAQAERDDAAARWLGLSRDERDALADLAAVAG